MTKKRVAIVVSHPIQHFCPQYASWSRLNGVDIRVFFASKQGLRPYQDERFGLTIQWTGLKMDFPHEFLEGADTRRVTTKVDASSLANQLRSFSPDVIIVYGYSQRLQVRALAWGGMNRIPVFMISDSELRGRRSVARRIVKHMVLRTVFSAADRFLTVGDANEAYYRNYGADDKRFVRCPFPIDVELYQIALTRREELRSALRQKLDIPEEHRVVLSVGKFVPWKRQLDLVGFVNRIAKSRSDVTVVLAGSGPDEPMLRSCAVREGPGGVVFAGFVTPEKLPEYYCASDVYVHCSDHEPHSLAISEAVFCGLPAVISDRCGSYGPSDDVRIGLNGLVYSCGDIDDLSRALIRIIDCRELCENMGRASSEIGRQNQRLAHGDALLQAIESISL